MSALPESRSANSRRDAQLRALVVDDSELVRGLLTRILGHRGYEVVAVADGESAVALAGDGFSIVVLDLTLPDMSGIEVCRRLRREPATTSIPILVLTGRLDHRDYRDAMVAGADMYLGKPFDMTELVATIERMEARGRLS